MWVYTMHFCVPVHNSVALLTNSFHATSEHHQQLGKSPLTHDVMNWKKITDFLILLVHLMLKGKNYNIYQLI